MRTNALCLMLAIGCGAAPSDPKATDPKPSESKPSDPKGSEQKPAEPQPQLTTGTTTAGVRYVGRFDASDPAVPRFAWPGSQIIVRFEGTALSATLDDESGDSHYDVTVDGVLRASPLVLTAGEKSYALASGLAAGTHTVELWRRTEAFVSVTRVVGFSVTGGKILAAPTPLARRLEFIGDSSISGWGIECTDGYDSFSAPTENEHKTYPALVSAALSAEHSSVAYSGKGVSRNYDDGDPETFPSLYARATPDNADATWGFDQWKPDLVWIALGGVDYVDSGRPAPDPATFEARYDELVALVRAKNPNAHIVASIEGRMTDAEPVGYDALTNMRTILNAVVSKRNAAGDQRISFFELPRTQDGERNGCDQHTTAAFHARVATAVASEIAARLGW